LCFKAEMSHDVSEVCCYLATAVFYSGAQR
jgi:hypothetical protein